MPTEVVAIDAVVGPVEVDVVEEAGVNDVADEDVSVWLLDMLVADVIVLTRGWVELPE